MSGRAGIDVRPPRPHHLAPVLAASAAALTLVACGATGRHRTTASTSRVGARTARTTSPKTTTRPAPKPSPPPPDYPQVLPAALGSSPTSGAPAVRWRGQTVAWITRTPGGVAIVTFDQRQLTLHLHSGTIDAGTQGWRYGPSVNNSERARLVAGFNGGFRLSTGAGGFVAYGKVAVPLENGLGSIVTYSNGTTDVGSWRQEVPAPGKHVVSVRQNLHLLIDHGAAAGTDCTTCWGASLGGVDDPARSALGVTAAGRLLWVGGTNLTVPQLAAALLSAHAVRAVELDINPEWVAAYLYGHRGAKGPLAPVPALPSQQGIPGQYLAPWSRDFFTIVAR